MSAYAEALAELHDLEIFGIRLGLEAVRDYCRAHGHPERAYRCLHVAGTNGKGTTAACLAALGTAHGLRTGLYTSPHLVELRERFRIDGAAIDEAALVDAWGRVRGFASARSLTFFEATTLIALERFAAAEVDLAVVEVGLGGRLDATNVVRPEAAIVTNVALDHEAQLGSSLARIAAEKAGIAKRGVPTLVGDGRPAEVAAALREAVGRAGSPIAFLDDEVELDRIAVEPDRTRFRYCTVGSPAVDLAVPAPGVHFARGAALAAWAWETVFGPAEAGLLRSAIGSASLPGRSQRVVVDGVVHWLDVAHNPAAAGALAETLAADGARPALVLGVLADKDGPRILDRLLPGASGAWLCGLATAGARRLDRPRAEAWLDGRSGVAWAETVADGLDRARRLVERGHAERVVVTGSYRTVGEALLELGLARPGEPYPPAPTPAPIAA